MTIPRYFSDKLESYNQKYRFEIGNPKVKSLDSRRGGYMRKIPGDSRSRRWDSFAEISSLGISIKKNKNLHPASHGAR